MITEKRLSMKKTAIVATLALLMASSVMATSFSPELLKFSAPSSVLYDFDGKDLEIPVTLTGKPASVVFCVFTKDRGESIIGVKNGYLGWHYVNKIDTAIYISQPAQFGVGSNAIKWNGRDDDGGLVPGGEYTYYLWGYDNVSSKQVVNETLLARGGSGGKQAHIQEYGPAGDVLANPVWYNKGNKQKWVIGSDPSDETLIETTDFTLGGGWSTAFTLALMPGDHSRYFLRVAHRDNKVQGVRKMIWVPNGMSEFDIDWGEDGIVSWSNIGSANMGAATDQAGPEIVGSYLYTANNLLRDTSIAHTSIVAIDWEDGVLDRTFDISEWWGSFEDQEGGGQLNGGPNGLIERKGVFFLNCHCSCLKQMVNPAAEDEDDFIVWSNGNGDYMLDHNFEPESTKKWVCNDLQVGPYTYHLAPDNNLFSIGSAYDMGAVSFGLLAPDGTGIAYMAYSGETAAWKWFNIIVDSGCAFDGIYCDNQSSSTADFGTENITGIYYIAHDSIKGVIANQIVGVTEDVPAVFAVSQNAPNPFNPTTTISFSLSRPGQTMVEVYNTAGQKVDTLVNAHLDAGAHSVTWNAANFSAGVYFYTVKCGDFSKTMKMTLLK